MQHHGTYRPRSVLQDAVLEGDIDEDAVTEHHLVQAAAPVEVYRKELYVFAIDSTLLGAITTEANVKLRQIDVVAVSVSDE